MGGVPRYIKVGGVHITDNEDYLLREFVINVCTYIIEDTEVLLRFLFVG